MFFIVYVYVNYTYISVFNFNIADNFKISEQKIIVSQIIKFMFLTMPALISVLNITVINWK